MAPRETENNAYAKFGVTKKEHYGGGGGLFLDNPFDWELQSVCYQKDVTNGTH